MHYYCYILSVVNVYNLLYFTTVFGCTWVCIAPPAREWLQDWLQRKIASAVAEMRAFLAEEITPARADFLKQKEQFRSTLNEGGYPFAGCGMRCSCELNVCGACANKSHAL